MFFTAATPQHPAGTLVVTSSGAYALTVAPTPHGPTMDPKARLATDQEIRAAAMTRRRMEVATLAALAARLGHDEVAARVHAAMDPATEHALDLARVLAA